MHNLLLYLQFNPRSAATLPGIPPPNFCKQDLASLPTKSASNSKQMIWVHLGIPVKHSSKKKKTFPQHSSQAKKCQQDAPVKSRALNSVLLSAWPVKKSTSSIVLYRGRSQGQDSPNIVNSPIKSPKSYLDRVIYSFVKTTQSAPWSLKLGAPKSKHFAWPKHSPFQEARIGCAFLGLFEEAPSTPRHVFLFYC